MIMSIDGNFGLCMKATTAGTSTRPPLYRDTMFVSQQIVNEYVQTYQQEGHKLEGMMSLSYCNHLLTYIGM